MDFEHEVAGLTNLKDKPEIFDEINVKKTNVSSVAGYDEEAGGIAVPGLIPS